MIIDINFAKPRKKCWDFVVIPTVVIGYSAYNNEILITAGWLCWGFEMKISRA